MDPIHFFSGGWSYSNEEMTEFFKHISYKEDMSILEFGSGDSSNKIYNYIKQYYSKNVTMYTYESDPNYIRNFDGINAMLYDENDIDSVVLPDIQFDIILIDGPNGDKRSLWYSKIRSHVKPGTILLIDDFNHYKCFSDELDRNFNYILLSHNDDPPLPGNKSWKIVKVLNAKTLTTQPVTTQPVTTQPVTTQPVTTQPVTTQPVTTPNTITAIINIYKRPHVLDEQIAAIRAQTVAPVCIFIWNNGNNDIDLSKYKSQPNTCVFDNNHNYGVWSRFLLGFLAPTEHLCIFDDDTIPGPRWFENCLTSMKEKEALYGTIGVVFDKFDSQYECIHRYGWDGPTDTIQYVDIVGHSWFFKRDWLNYLVREPLDIYRDLKWGEDMGFSFMLQKYANIPTCVPPHPETNKDLWGSIKPRAYGTDQNATSTNYWGGFHGMYAGYIERGFKRLISRTTTNSITDFQQVLTKLRDRIPFALIRPADGEYMVLQNTTLTNIDNWTFTAGGKLYNDLHIAIELAVKNSCYIGIPCRCCNETMATWYIQRFNPNPNYTTFANMFVNANWKHWVQFIKDEQLQFTLVGSSNKSNFLVKNHIVIPEFLVNDWDTKGEEYTAMVLNEVKKTKNAIYMFSCGPIAKILIAKAWAEHPFNCYIDIGSSLDLFLKGSTNRDYTVEGSYYSQLICKFDDKLIQLKP